MQHLFDCTGASDLCHVGIKVLIALDSQEGFTRKLLLSNLLTLFVFRNMISPLQYKEKVTQYVQCQRPIVLGAS